MGKRIQKPTRVSKPAVYYLSEPVFRTKVTLYVNCPWVEARKLLLQNKEPYENLPDEKAGDGNMGLAMYLRGTETKGTYQVLWINKFDWTIEDMGCLAHEIKHITHQSLGFKEIPLNQDTDELYAYFFECYFTQALQCLKSKKK